MGSFSGTRPPPGRQPARRYRGCHPMDASALARRALAPPAPASEEGFLGRGRGGGERRERGGEGPLEGILEKLLSTGASRPPPSPAALGPRRHCPGLGQGLGREAERGARNMRGVMRLLFSCCGLFPTLPFPSGFRSEVLF